MSPLQALQRALAAEHAIVYGYGVVGAHSTGRARRRALAALAAHEIRRDRIADALRREGTTPVAALPAYQLPFAVTGPATARQLAVHLEEGGAGAAWDLIDVSAGATRQRDRSLAVEWLRQAAARITEWGGAVPALPGQPT